MHHRAEVVKAGQALRDQGYRLTPQRLMILDAVIAGEEHVTAEAIYQTVAAEYPDMSLSTVYRTLETLRDLGLVTETDMGSGRVEYHFADRAKHHREVDAESDQDEEHLIEDEMIDLEPVLRDAVLPSLPFQPVCRDDCPGLCSECGARLEDDHEHTHEQLDPRWAALQGLLDRDEPKEG